MEIVRDIVASKEGDINDDDVGDTPLMCAMMYNQVDIVRFLLTQPELQLGKVGRDGETALHSACYNNNYYAVRLFCQDRRCGPSIVNMKNNNGVTALMVAVFNGNLEVVKEMEKVEGTDFSSKKQKTGKTMIDVARMMRNNEMVEYLIQRKKKVDSLTVLAAFTVAKYVKHKRDVEVLDIPYTLQPLVKSFVDEDEREQ